MVFAFFRRRQKMVVIIMVVLMVSFLVGMKGLQMLFSPTPRGEHVIGKIGETEITQRDLDSARRDLEQLTQYIGLGRFLGPHHEAFSTIRRNDAGARLAYCLLLREAGEAGITISRDEIDRFLVAVAKDPRTGEPLVEGVYRNHIADMREKGMTEDLFRSLLARWLTVYKAYAATAVQTPPASAEAGLLLRDLAEQINLRVLRIGAEDLLKDVSEKVPDNEIEVQYARYASRLAGVPASADAFGFGYLVPHRVGVGYLLIDAEAISRAVRPTDEVIGKYWIKHEAEFTKQVPVDPAGSATTKPASAPTTKPASAATTKPTSAPAAEPEMKTVKMTLAEATDEIIERLRGGEVRDRLDSVTNRIAVIRDKLAGDADTGQLDTYRQILKQMALQADGALKRKVTTKFTAIPLDKAVAKLARAARLTGICYPWGEQGQYNLDPKIKVSLDASIGMTLAVALDRITAQAFGAPAGKDEDKKSDKKKDKDKPDKPVTPPTLRWAMCKGLEGMLFCRGGDVNLFPIRVARTDLLDRNGLATHEVLKGAATARRGGTPMVAEAFSIKEFGVSGRAAATKVGRDGKQMYVRNGLVIWRVLEARRSHEPVKKGTKASEFPPDLRARVARDVRLKQAFDAAIRRARQIEAKARKDGLAAAAKGEKLETSETGLFPRKRAVELQQMVRYPVWRFGLEGIEALDMPPYIYPWSRVANVNLPPRDLSVEIPALKRLGIALQDYQENMYRRFQSALQGSGAMPDIQRYLKDSNDLRSHMQTLQPLYGPYFSRNTHGAPFMEKAFSLMPADLDKRGPGKPPAVTVFLLPARKEVYVLERIDHLPLVAGDTERFVARVSFELVSTRRWRGMRKWFSVNSIVARTGYERVAPTDE